MISAGRDREDALSFFDTMPSSPSLHRPCTLLPPKADTPVRWDPLQPVGPRRSEKGLISYPIGWFDPQPSHWRTVRRSQRSAYEGGSLLGTRGVTRTSPKVRIALTYVLRLPDHQTKRTPALPP